MLPSLCHVARAIAFLIAVGFAAATAADATEAHLVHCGAETCLQLSGHRQGAAVEVLVNGRALAADGGDNWHAIVPLAIARSWRTLSADALAVTLANAQMGTEQTETVLLPPGALGRHVDLQTLLVRAD